MLELKDPIVQFALKATTQASELVRQVQAEMAAPALTKDDRSPVTVADFAAQALIANRLAETFPEDILVAEEASDALRETGAEGTLEKVTSYTARFAPGANPDRVCGWIDRGAGRPEGRYWVLDPIDGTKGFLRGGQYVVALALIDSGQVQLGVLGCPNLEDGRREKYGGAGTLMAAQRGSGAWITPLAPRPEDDFKPDDFERARVSGQEDPAEARLLRSFEAAHTNTETIDTLMAEIGTRHEALRLDSQAKYALLASGTGEIMVRLLSPSNPDYEEKTWDQASGSLIVEEAGGRISDLSGKPLDFTQGRTLKANRGVLATNGRLHDLVVEKLAVLAP
jgi:3'(2'), 5'-bisphosphate nucleotidase